MTHPRPTPARRPYLHLAVLQLAPDADERAPGGAVTVELCGSWEHPPPCPLAAHHTAVRRPADPADTVELRIVFATEPEREAEVRQRIDRVLATGAQLGPDGVRTTWQLRGSGPGEPTAADLEHGRRMAGP